MVAAQMSNILLLAFAVVAAVFDIKARRIPNKLVLSMLGVWLLIFAYGILAGTDAAGEKLLDSALGFLIGGGIFITVYFISRKGLGAGDVKFMAAAGLYLGIGGTIPAILYGTILAAATGLVLILLKKIERKDKVPLAPFLLAGIALAMV